MKCNPILSFDIYSSRTVNGRIVRANGINMPKGVILVSRGISFSKDGIADILSSYDCTSAMAARLVGFVDLIFTVLLFPFTIIAYVICFILALLSWVLLWPFALCCWDNIKFKTYMTFMAIALPTAALTLLVTVVLLPLTALQILVPELTVFVFRIHRWGKTEATIFS